MAAEEHNIHLPLRFKDVIISFWFSESSGRLCNDLGEQSETIIYWQYSEEFIFFPIHTAVEFSEYLTMCVQVGEDVPDARKCACASHVATIADFFQVGLPKVKQTSFTSLLN